MKLQYLGDSKDCFKWDYLDQLANLLGFPTLTVIPMLTPDDGCGHGNTSPEDFPAGKKIWGFCDDLRQARELKGVRELPKHTGSAYSIILNKPDLEFSNQSRQDYFSNIASSTRQLVFADPDNGFEPERRFDERHIRYGEVANLLDQISEGSVISVFQHFRYKKFGQDYARIRERLGDCHSTAICWDGRLMFVTVGKSSEVISSVAKANIGYAKSRPVRVIA